MKPPRIETDRLVLTWPSEAQIRGYHDAIVGSDIFDTILWDGPSSPGELLGYWRDRRADGPPPIGAPLELAVIERASDRMIGGISFRPTRRWAEVADVGYAFAPDAHGQGFATEAVGALVDHGFEERAAERVFATIFVGNVASRRVVEKLGFVYEGTLRHAVHKRGAWVDEWLLAITRPDWEARRESAQ